MSNPQKSYLQQLAAERSGGRATEHSFRPALKTLVEALGGDSITATNEPTRVACGAPDFIVERGGVPIGHIECKKIGADLDEAERSEQLLRYRAGLPNLILTDYLRFRWFRDGELRMKEVQLSRPEPGEQQILRGNGSALKAMFDGFFAAEPPVVENPDELAKRMAALAHLLREGVLHLLIEESGKEKNPQRDLFEAYRRVLMRGLSEEDFADMYAQTVAYGLFAARRLEPLGRHFSRKCALFTPTTPFLNDILLRLAGPNMDNRISWIADDLASLLGRADMAAILRHFGSGSEERDPVVHFYENFLAAYDPRLREMRGVYYTPESVVSYIVRSVDYLLRKKFGLSEGIADYSKIPGPAGQSKQHRVLILDPAAGTGTFLAHVIQHIYEIICEEVGRGAWASYAREHLLQRLFGYEFLMAPYAICHMKLDLKLDQTGAKFNFSAESGSARSTNGDRLHVYLTNTLESAADSVNGNLFMAHELEREAKSANAVKSEKPVMVVLGNPPYSGHSANKSEWIEDLMRGNDGGKCCANYFTVDGEPLCERNPKWLNDDYVKFIRFAQWRIEQTGEGIIGFITNHAWLDNPTFRGMRQSLLDSFDEIYVLDLHGNARKKERAPDGGRDENVFDIQQGVAISRFVKNRAKKRKKQRAQVHHADLWGERKAGKDGGKSGWLEENDVKTTQWTALAPKAPLYLFVPRDDELAKEYERGWKITEIFPVNGVGTTTARDDMVIDFERESLLQRVALFRDSRDSDEALCEQLGISMKKGWNIEKARENIRDERDLSSYVQPILYRPFDERLIFYHDSLVWRTVRQVMRHMFTGENMGLIMARQGTGEGFTHAFVSKTLIDGHITRGNNIGYLAPLYLYPTPGGASENEAGPAPNLNPEFITALEQRLGLAFTPGKKAARKFTPEDIFHYIYAVLHSPAYRSRYAGFLKSDFPRIPLPESVATFRTLAKLGAKLAALHLMETEPPKANSLKFSAGDECRIERVRYAEPSPSANGARKGRIWISKKQYIEPVPPEVWNFTIGGYQPAKKWLADRKGRTLTHSDIVHYRRICATLAQTHRLMATIDDTFQPTPESTPNA